MHEVVTLQFGHKANYVGTHFWNTQESYFTYNPADSPSIVDHDINFRPGIGSDGSDTYTPRALIYDLKSGYGSLRRVNALYDIVEHDEPSSLWHGTQQMQTAPTIAPSPYQVALEAGLPTSQLRSNDVRYWSDFNRIFFHPRSLVQLSSQSLTSQLSTFESHGAGTDLFRDLDQEVGGLLDRDLRLFIEECDSLQGFQIMGSSDDAWGGFMSRYVEELKEDFGKKSVWVWGIEDGRRAERAKQYSRLTNTTHTLTALADNTTAYVRLSTVPSKRPNYVHLEADSDWSAAALISSMIESVTLPTRIRPSRGIRPSSMALYEDLLGGGVNRSFWNLSARIDKMHGTRVNGNGTTDGASADGAIHDPRISSTRHGGAGTEDESSEIQPTSYDITLTPRLPQVQSTFPSLSDSTRNLSRNHVFAQVESVRSMIPPPQTSDTQAIQQELQRYSLTDEERLRRLYNDESLIEIYNTPLGYPLLDSFPRNLFNVDPADFAPIQASVSPLTSTRDQIASDNRTSIPLSAALSTDSTTKTDLITMRDLVVGRTGRAMGLVDVEERETMYDDLTRLAETYNFGFDDGEDDDNGHESGDGFD